MTQRIKHLINVDKGLGQNMEDVGRATDRRAA